MRVDTIGLPTDNWHHFLRLRDLRQVFGEMPLDGISRVLELGAGDGGSTRDFSRGDACGYRPFG